MTPQAIGKMPNLTESQQAQIVELRRNGLTIAEIVERMELGGRAAMAAVQDCCLRYYGKRDYCGPEVGHLPGKTKSFRRAMAP